MSMDKEAIQKLGRLSRIALGDQQAEQIADELSNILRWIAQLKEVDVEGVTPMTSVLEAHAHPRADIVYDGYAPKRVLANAPQEIRGYYIVPKVIEQDTT